MIAVPVANWNVFRTMSCEKFTATLVDLARPLDPHKYTKNICARDPSLRSG